MRKMKSIKLLAIPLLLGFLFTACKKEALDTRPSNGVSPQEIFGTVEKINSTLISTYKSMFAFSPTASGDHDEYGQKSWDLSNDLMGNDMIVNTQGYGWYN